MKLRPIFGFFAVLLIAGIWLLPSALTWFKPNPVPDSSIPTQPAVAVQQPEPTQQVVNILPAVEAPADVAFTPVTEQTSNGIWISAKNFKYDAKLQTISVDVCFQLPTPQDDWLVDNAQIRVGDAETSFPNVSASLLSFVKTQPDGTRQLETYDANGNPRIEAAGDEFTFDQRCDRLDFTVSGDVSERAVITLEISSLWAYPSEGEECNTALRIAQSRLDAQQTGIRLGCEQNEYGAQIFAAEKPATMSDDEAGALVAAAWQQAYTYSGSWMFTGVLP